MARTAAMQAPATSSQRGTVMRMMTYAGNLLTPAIHTEDQLLPWRNQKCTNLTVIMKIVLAVYLQRPKYGILLLKALPVLCIEHPLIRQRKAT